jgi:hypothetical protein
MAPGNVHRYYHDKFWLFGFLISFGIGIIVFRNNLFHLMIYEISYVIFYWLGENVVSPDLDQIVVGSQDAKLITFGEKIAIRLKKLKFLAKIIGFFVGLPALFFSLWSAVYAYGNQFLGGHRNFWSHSFMISTVGRMIWFDIVIFIGIWNFYLFGVKSWRWNTSLSFEFYLDVWLFSALLGQFLAWTISDSIHLILDSRWAKERLY